MATRIFVGLLAALLAAGSFLLGSTIAQRRAGALATEAAAAHAAELGAARMEGQRLADTIARGQAEAVLRAFAAGITPSLLAERHDSVEIAAVGLLRIAGVLAIDVFQPDGTVLYSSDAKLMTTRVASDADRWALEVTELVSRPSDRAGALVLATPVIDNAGTLAVIRLGFDLQAVRNATPPSA